MKSWYLSKNFVLFIMVLLLLFSGYINFQNSEEKKAYDRELLKAYVQQIHRASSSAERALEEVETETAFQDWIRISVTALEVAEQTAANLGNHNRKYALGNGAAVYTAIPLELRSLILRGQDAGLEKTELEKIVAVLNIYTDSINQEAITEPNNFHKIYLDIHQTIQENRILENGEELILNKIAH